MPVECCSLVPLVVGLFTLGYVVMIHVTLRWLGKKKKKLKQ